MAIPDFEICAKDFVERSDSPDFTYTISKHLLVLFTKYLITTYLFLKPAKAA